MLELLVDGEVIKFVHILQEPKVIMESGGFFGVFHHFAHVQELHIDYMHVHILALVLL
jgi:hypothetical protein